MWDRELEGALRRLASKTADLLDAMEDHGDRIRRQMLDSPEALAVDEEYHRVKNLLDSYGITEQALRARAAGTSERAE